MKLTPCTKRNRSRVSLKNGTLTRTDEYLLDMDAHIGWLEKNVADMRKADNTKAVMREIREIDDRLMFIRALMARTDPQYFTSGYSLCPTPPISFLTTPPAEDQPADEINGHGSSRHRELTLKLPARHYPNNPVLIQLMRPSDLRK